MVSIYFCNKCMTVLCVLLLMDSKEPYRYMYFPCWLETYIFSFHCNIHPYNQLSNQNYYYTAYILKKWIEKKKYLFLSNIWKANKTDFIWPTIMMMWFEMSNPAVSSTFMSNRDFEIIYNIRLGAVLWIWWPVIMLMCLAYMHKEMNKG